MIFYEEPLDEETYDQPLIEDLFSGQKKIRVSKDLHDRSRGRSLAAHMSRIETEGFEDSDQSIAENQTLQALQKYNLNKIIKDQEATDAFLQEQLGQSFRDKTLRGSTRQQKIELGQIVEFFEPIRKKKALSKKYKSTKMKDKGSTQKHAIFNKKVPTDSSTQDEHGLINFYGNVLK